MSLRYQIIAVAYGFAASFLFVGQSYGQALSITNYKLVSEQRVTRTQSNVTYSTDVVNAGPALSSVTATLTTSLPNIALVPGQSTLSFGPVPANGQVTSSNTFTILVDRAVPFSFSDLHWTFQSNAPPPPVANAGANQTARVGNTVTLNGSASTNPSGSGTLTYSWAVTSRPPGSAATLLNPTSVTPTFVIDIPGNYVITLTVSNGTASSSASVTVSTVNTQPVANAGPNQTVALGATVLLNGSGSSDVDGNSLTYSWTLVTRPASSTATVTGANTVSPTFVADKPGTYVAQLIVNDGSANSNPATVTITTANTPPVANAGPNQTVNMGALVQLNGSGSTDVDGNPLIFKWGLVSVPTGSAAVLSNPAAVNPTFTADRPGTYVAQLIVNDGTVDSTPSTVMITTSSPLAPSANAGPNQTVPRNSTVTLSGSGNDPQGLLLTLQWALITKPAGSAATLSSTTVQNPTFTADRPGTYVAQLIVNNGSLNSAPSTVTITTANTPPVANAGPNQNVSVGATVLLNGSGSSDVDGDPLTYAWSFTSRPDGSTATLFGANTVAANFVADVAGTYVVQLIVNDGVTNSNPATTTITAARRTITLTPNPLNLSNAPGTLTVTLSVPAGTGGQVVNLASSNTGAATVPNSVTVPEGSTGANVTITPGATGGSATITASASGFTSGTTTINSAPQLTISFSQATLTITGTATQNLTLNLSAAAPAGGVTINLSSSNPAAATVPETVTFAAGATAVAVPVTGVAPGSTVIQASALPNIADITATVTVVPPPTITLSSGVSVGVGQSVPFPVTLSAAAPAGGLTVTLTSSDTSRVTVTGTVMIAAGATTPAAQPQVTGVGAGTANISASAPGYTSASQSVQVTPPLMLSFSPSTLTITQTATQNLTLNLSPGAPAGGLAVNVRSDDPSVATVPAIVTFAAGATSVSVPVTGVAQGSTNIHASSLQARADATASVTVQPVSGGSRITVGNASVGQNLQAPVIIQFSPPTPAGTIVTVASSDPAKLVVAARQGFAGSASINLPLPEGVTSLTVYAQALAGSGTVALNATAPNYPGGSGTITLTPSGFVFIGPDGPVANFSTDQGVDTPIPVSAARLDASLNFVEIQQVRGDSSVTVSLASSNPAVGTITPAMTFAGGTDTAQARFTALTAGSTTLTTGTPPGFSTPNQSRSVTVQVNPTSMSIQQTSVVIGQNLETDARVVLAGVAPDAGLTVTVTSNDPSRLLLSTDPTAAGSASIPLVVPGRGRGTQTFYVQALGSSGNATYTASAPGFGSATQTVTLAPSGFVIASPFGLGINFLTTTGAADSNITVFAGLLDTSLNFVTPQLVRGGFSANVEVTSSNPAVGTITRSPVTITGGSSSGVTQFNPTGAGTTTLTAGVPVGFSTPAALRTVTATVNTPGISVTESAVIGQNLQSVGLVVLGQQAPAGGLAVTLTSGDPSKLLLSSSGTSAGAPSLTITVPAGDTNATYYLQALGNSGTVSYTATAPGYTSRTGTVTLAPSGLRISTPLGSFFTTSVSSGLQTPLTITTAQLDPGSNNAVAIQPLRGGLSVTVNLTNQDPAVGSVVSPVTIPGGSENAVSNFTPLSQGRTQVTVNPPANFGLSNQTSVTGMVTP